VSFSQEKLQMHDSEDITRRSAFLSVDTFHI